ncbi:hypothetical protein HOU03_gp233 [Caulobacter phage CcrSC]|uniref:Uncharacterized protein n=1 Tax=Caulobacter phage CcrSC TaxID=2283272 RepID=A0A385EFZ3_9CAUD|nr:hypothetical protein HOU03_gp233 [Caulobacter phage CcrSC]AXQ70035.1 hypothetical protein CcrSC_gp453 [Caulobacter phage CcrSC]
MSDYERQFEERFDDLEVDRRRARSLIDDFATHAVPEDKKDAVDKLIGLANYFDHLEIKLDVETAIAAWALVEEALLCAPEEIDDLIADIERG